MCGRFRVRRSDKAAFAEKYGIRIADVPDYVDQLDATEREECSPGSMQDVVRLQSGEREFASMRWGFNLTIQGKNKLVFNTKSEGVMESPMWRKRFAENRCIVPATAFLEWPGKVKTAISLKDRDVIGLAGLWGNWTNPKTRQLEPTFSIFTTEPNAVMQPIHNRQPVILNPSEYDEWLEPNERPPVHLLRVFPEELTVVKPVGSNDVTPTLF